MTTLIVSLKVMYLITSFLTVMSELYQKELISEYDIHEFPHCHYMTGYSSRHWLDSLVDIQSSKPADVHARTFDMLKKYSLTKEMQSKHTGVTIPYFHLYVYVYICACMYIYLCVLCHL